LKVFKIIHTIYIVLISAMLVMSSYQGSFRWLFSSEKCYMIHFCVGVLLIIIAISIIFAHFKLNSLVGLLQIFWWIPQLLVVVIKVFSTDRRSMELYSLYYWPYPFNLSFELGWELSPNEYLFVQLNFVPLIAISLTLLFISRSKKRKLCQKSQL
jgi:hypothetical protein